MTTGGDTDVFRGLPIDYLVTIGDRLLVGICLSESLDSGMGEGIKKSLAAGKQLRDRAGFNRFRLVVTSDEAGSIAPAIEEQFKVDAVTSATSGRTYSMGRVKVTAVRLSISKEPLLAAQFAKLCLSDAGREVLRRHSFAVPSGNE